MQLIKSQLKAGVWEAMLVGAGPNAPDLRATHLGEIVDGLTCKQDPQSGDWRVSLPLPPEVLSDGVQTVIIRDAAGATLASIPIICGDALDEDLRAEVALLRDELALLQKAFRNHCG